MSALLIQVDPDPNGPLEPTTVRKLTEQFAHVFPKQDLHNMASSPYRQAATNIYKARDGQYLHLHGIESAATIEIASLTPKQEA